MPTEPKRNNSLSQKLRNLGRLRLKTEDKEPQRPAEFQIVHTPDRPPRLITPIEAPTEEECLFDIRGWHLAADNKRVDSREGSRTTVRFAESDYSQLRREQELTGRPQYVPPMFRKPASDKQGGRFIPDHDNVNYENSSREGSRTRVRFIEENDSRLRKEQQEKQQNPKPLQFIPPMIRTNKPPPPSDGRNFRRGEDPPFPIRESPGPANGSTGSLRRGKDPPFPTRGSPSPGSRYSRVRKARLIATEPEVVRKSPSLVSDNNRGQVQAQPQPQSQPLRSSWTSSTSSNCSDVERGRKRKSRTDNGGAYAAPAVNGLSVNDDIDDDKWGSSCSSSDHSVIRIDNGRKRSNSSMEARVASSPVKENDNLGEMVRHYMRRGHGPKGNQKSSCSNRCEASQRRPPPGPLRERAYLKSPPALELASDDDRPRSSVVPPPSPKVQDHNPTAKGKEKEIGYSGGFQPKIMPVVVIPQRSTSKTADSDKKPDYSQQRQRGVVVGPSNPAVAPPPSFNERVLLDQDGKKKVENMLININNTELFAQGASLGTYTEAEHNRLEQQPTPAGFHYDHWQQPPPEQIGRQQYPQRPQQKFQAGSSSITEQSQYFPYQLPHPQHPLYSQQQYQTAAADRHHRQQYPPYAAVHQHPPPPTPPHESSQQHEVSLASPFGQSLSPTSQQPLSPMTPMTPTTPGRTWQQLWAIHDQHFQCWHTPEQRREFDRLRRKNPHDADIFASIYDEYK